MEGQAALIDQKAVAVALVAIFCLAVLPILPAYFSPRLSEPFSELGILGPGMRFGDYPSQVSANQTLTLFILVTNHEGNLAYYRVYVKVGDLSGAVDQNEPLKAPPIATYEKFLLDNQTWIQHSELRITEPNPHTRLVFELWMYDLVNGDFAYTGQWNQLLLNVTATTQG